MLHALETSQAIDVSPEEYALSENGGRLPTDSDRYVAFCERLKAAEFTTQQLMLINDAFREARLELRAATAKC